jgi:serine/threonine protein phosphatase PrpC
MEDASVVKQSMAFRFAQMTNVGGRESNQDALGCAQQDGLACFVVSDGVGGQAGGEIASSIIVNTIKDRFVQAPFAEPNALRAHVEYATAEIVRRKAEQEQLQNMSATVAAVLLDLQRHCAVWAHMGDTRLYLFRNDKISAVTKDHSLVQQFVDAGYCKPADLRTHPLRGTLYAAIGAEGDTHPEVTEIVVDIRDGDAFFICTDGFWEWIAEEEMEQALSRAATVENWLADMCRIAEQHSVVSTKSRDNYTAFAIWIGDFKR